MGEIGPLKRERTFAAESVRGLSVWAGAAILGSFSCSLAMAAAMDSDFSRDALRDTYVFGLSSLIFTLPGSGLLMLAFAWMGQWSLSLIARYLCLVAIGGVAGAAILMLPGVPLWGFSYGSATALFWSILHAAIYRGR
jgi:hypothetical protein